MSEVWAERPGGSNGARAEQAVETRSVARPDAFPRRCIHRHVGRDGPPKWVDSPSGAATTRGWPRAGRGPAEGQPRSGRDADGTRTRSTPDVAESATSRHQIRGLPHSLDADDSRGRHRYHPRYHPVTSASPRLLRPRRARRPTLRRRFPAEGTGFRVRPSARCRPPWSVTVPILPLLLGRWPISGHRPVRRRRRPAGAVRRRESVSTCTRPVLPPPRAPQRPDPGGFRSRSSFCPVSVSASC